MFTWSRRAGLSLEEARTAAVNTLVVMEVFHRFSVRYLRVALLTPEGVLGTKAVLIGLGGVVALQLVFTYAPFMQSLFDTRPLGLRTDYSSSGSGRPSLAYSRSKAGRAGSPRGPGIRLSSRDT